MAFRLLTRECLQELIDKYNEYRAERIRIIEWIRDRKMKEWVDEYNHDLKRGKYSIESMDEWYDNNIERMNNWLKRCNDKILNADEKFQRVLDRAADYEFDDKDLGKRINFDFADGEVYISSNGDPEHYTATFTVGNASYWWDPIPETKTKMKTVTPEFTELYEYK